MATSKRKFNANEDKYDTRKNPAEIIGGALATHASNLWGEVAGANRNYFTGVSISRRPDGSYLAALRSKDGADKKWVCFGRGESFVGCLVALSSAIATDAWKEDTF